MNKLGQIKVSGTDAAKLLQGQLTCDVNALTDKQYSLAALCNPQGRVISLFYLAYLNDAYYLILPENILELTLTALKKYAVFYKLALEDTSDTLANVLTNIGNPTLFDTQAGVPRIHPETSGTFLPHDINLDQLGAISFNKGCYTGQEIIARMQYRGKLKKRLHQTTVASDESLKPGSDHTLGTIVDIAQHNNQTIILYIAPFNEAE